MDPINTKQRSQRTREEAAEWFVELREGSIEPAARDAFNAWLRTSPENIEAFLEIAALWMDVPAAVDANDIDVEALIAYANEEGNVVSLQDTQPASGKPQRASDRPRASADRRPGFLAGIAASVLLVMAGAAAWWYLERGIYETAIGEQRSLTLDDGSSVQLNARSKIRVRFSERQRGIELLEGQALFHVAKDRARPFVVDAGDTRVRAVGTQFDVYRKPGGTIITVVEGRVAVVSDEQPSRATSVKASGETPPAVAVPLHAEGVQLAAGEQITVSPREVAEPIKTDTDAVTAWTRRQLIFRGAPLAEVAMEFNRYNRQQIVIDDEELGRVRVGATFSSTDPAMLVSFLREQLQVAVEARDETIQITRR